MARIILITGGARSGKSGFAQRLAEAIPGTRAYIATSPATDPEMAERIARHRKEREGRGWQTLEEPINLADAIAGVKGCETIVVDCLTLWVNNLVYQAKEEIQEDTITKSCLKLLAACRDLAGTIIFVTNEVGWGIVPDNPLARRFRDLVGRCNQVMAEGADDVFLVSCAIPLQLKGKDNRSQEDHE